MRRTLRWLIFLGAVVVATPAAVAAAGGPGAPDTSSSAERGKPRHDSGGRGRPTREQIRFALILVGAAAGVYVVYRLIRR